MDDHDHTVSLRLYEILDWIGASEEMRSKFIEISTVSDVLTSLSPNLFDMYTFGSYCEGTTTTGLKSDVDSLYCHDEPVVEIVSDASQHGLSYLIVTDETTKPGYCKLQAIWNKVPIYHPYTSTKYECVPDQYGKMCLHHLHAIKDEFPAFAEINGPAMTMCVIGRLYYDLVFSLRCNHIPSFAKSWVTRVTSCKQLNETEIKMLTEFGCFFVGKNHPSSQNGPIEWRLSFSLQERELMYNLNPTQHKCYILLKMIKNDIILQRVPESISSYHCKTCVLYAIERTPLEFWTRRNLLECVLLCIKLLLHWVNEQYCPNYFIPGENMFDRIQHRTLRQVRSVLEDMVEHWCRFIWSIICDDIGNMMSNVLSGCGPSIMRKKHNNVFKTTLVLYDGLIKSIRAQTMKGLNQCNSISASNSFVNLHSMQTHHLLTDCVRDHTENETRQAIRYFIPHIRLQIARCIASSMLTTLDTYRLRMMFGWFKYYIEESKSCDTISAYLIIASYCLQSDRNDICQNILHQCKMSLKSHVLSMCGCHIDRPIHQSKAEKELARMLCSHDIQYTEFARTCTAGCLSFLPHQANLVPSALHYEMYRSVYTPPDSRQDNQYFWFDWMVVDSHVYLYFMQYVLFTKMNKPVYKQYAIDNLRHVIHTYPNLGHIETACNLLGWINKQENKIQQAFEWFLVSWRIRPVHNAVKWHLLELIRSINSFNSDGHMLLFCFEMTQHEHELLIRSDFI